MKKLRRRALLKKRIKKANKVTSVESLLILSCAALVAVIVITLILPINSSESVSQDSIDCKVLLPIVNSSEDIVIGYIYWVDPYIDNPYLDKEPKEEPLPLLNQEPCEWLPAGDGCNKCCGNTCTLMYCASAEDWNSFTLKTLTVVKP